jgi:hypothetical protein
MDIEPFSADVFKRLDSPVFTRSLAEKLQEAVLRKMAPVIAEAFARVVAALNANGHNLAPYGVARPGEFMFRDESEQGQCRLRLACDVIISAGYADTSSLKE